MSMEQIYDRWADFYERLYENVDAGVEEAQRTFARLLKDVPPGGRVLDVGCGIGFTSIALRKLGYEVLGIDVSSRSLQRASDLAPRYPEAQQRLAFSKADVLTFAEVGQYDAVVAMASLIGHLLEAESQKIAIANMVQALKPDGILLLGCHDYQQMLTAEPAEYVTPVNVIGAGPEQRLVFQRRRWRGSPRERVHECRYHMIEADGKLRQVVQQARAITQEEVTAAIVAAGGTDVIWISPDRSGYYQPIAHAKRRAGAAGAETVPGRLVVHRATSAAARSRRSLVMWSGGPRSSAALRQILAETSDEVKIHHIRSSDRASGQASPESVGGHALTDSANILTDIQAKHRSFEVTLSTIGPGTLCDQTDRMNAIAYMAAQAAMSWQLTRFDRIVLGSFGGDELQVVRMDDPYASGRYLATEMVKTIMRSEDIPYLSSWMSPLAHFNHPSSLSKV